MSLETSASQHLVNTLTMQRNEAADRHANCLAQLNVVIEEKVAMAREVEGMRKEIARLMLELGQQPNKEAANG